MLQNLLREHGWLAHQPTDFQDKILACGKVLGFRAGVSVFGVGDPPGGLYGVVSGALAVSVAPRSTGPHFVSQSCCGAWLGEGAFLTGQPRRIGLETITEAALLFVPLAEMNRLSSDDPEAIRKFGQIALMNIDSCLEAINDLLIRTPSKRIAATLLRFLGAKHGGIVSVSQSNLGQAANASRKVVNQSLKSLADDGLVRIGYASIEIPDAAKLKKFAYDDGL